MSEPLFQSAWVKDALAPWKGCRMAFFNWVTKRLFGRDYFIIVGRR